MENVEASATKLIPSRQTSKLAILSFTLGIASLLCQLLLFVSLLNIEYPFRMEVILYVQPVLFVGMISTAFVALILGIISLVKRRRSGRWRGKGFAITGIICGGEFVMLVLLFIALWRPQY